ncbi:MAG TPA: thioredoxin domain-containing protein [Pyrinomonadaceae bacterium]|jgi:protein-disulfide isomerase
MNFRQAFLAALAGLLVFATIIPAQTPRRTQQSGRRNAPAAKPAAKPGPSGPAAPTASATPLPTGALAVVNGQPVMPSEIETQVRAIIESDPDPAVRAFYENTAQVIAEARRRALDARTNSLLVEAEARRRKISVAEFLEEEINSRVPPPSEAEIRAAYEANRAQMGGADLESVRPQLVGFLRGQRSEQLYENLATRLRMSHVVSKGADVGAQNLQPSTVLVTVADRTFTAGMLNERMKSYVYKLQRKVYEAQKRALDLKINDLLLISESQRRNVPPETIIREEITNKMRAPTDAEVSKFYEENKARISGDFNTVRSQVAAYLQDREQERVERALSARLRAGAQIRVLLAEPVPPVQAISVDDDPARGDANAPVTIVEFTDFQCPACGAMYPVIEEALKPYGNRVRFVVRDFPLPMHANAPKAAEAANAAKAQGKFFEYAALLFTHQDALDAASLKKYASDLGLDRARFDAELDSRKYAAEVQHDVEDGELYGVESTPTIFVNGVRLYDMNTETLRAMIDRALAQRGQTGPAGP